MRFVVRDWDDKPEILSTSSVVDELHKLIEGRVKTANVNIYRGTYLKEKERKSSVVDKLNDYYYEKCAYCESYCDAEVEHYRPKGSVSEDKNHKGYYWLSYEWSNLLPACHDCNKTGSKGTQFPILGTRVYKPPFDEYNQLDIAQLRIDSEILKNESPYLLHPELDNPEDFFTFQLDLEKRGIAIEGTDSPIGRGNQTKDIYKLNRPSLLFARQAAVEDIVNHINNYVEFLILSGNDEHIKAALIHCFRSIQEVSNDITKEHTLLKRLLIKNLEIFERLVIAQLDTSLQEIVRIIFIAFLKEHRD